MAAPGTFHNLDAIISELRSQLSKRGGADGIRTLGLCFALNDRDKNGTFDLDEFETVLQRCGIFLKKQEVSAVFRAFDRNNDKRISYKEFLRGVQGKLSDRRIALINKAFAKIDADGNGVLTLSDISAKYNASKHPDVLTGKKTTAQVMAEFVRGFAEQDDGPVQAAKAATANPTVSSAEFLSYFTDISASIPNDDDLFALMMCNCWGIKEGAAAPVAGNELQKFIATVKEKIRQKCKGRNEKEHLRLAFKFFDLDNSGSVSYSEFLYALEKFGVVLDEKSSRGLFASMDASANGRLSYDEFANALYDTEYQGVADEEDSLPPPPGVAGATVNLSATAGAGAAAAQQQQQQKQQFGATAKVQDYKTNGYGGSAGAKPQPVAAPAGAAAAGAARVASPKVAGGFGASANFGVAGAAVGLKAKK